MCMLLVVGLYGGLLPLQLFLSERKRLWTLRTNDNNPAARLPPEIQLRIFRLLASRTHFGHDERGHQWLGPPGPPSPSSLRACALVCRTWHACAVEVLYTDVSLCLLKHCIRFSRAIEQRPGLAQLVRRLELPGEVRGLPGLTPEHAVKPVYHQKRIRTPKKHLILWKDLRAAVDCLIVHCVHVDDIVLHGAGELDNFLGLAQFVPRLRRLALCSPNSYANINGINLPWGAQVLKFPSRALPLQFARLEFLSLYRHVLRAAQVDFPGDFVLAELHTLELVWCDFDEPWLASVFGRAPQLSVLRWRQVFVHDQPQFASLPAPQLLRTVQERLAELSIRQQAGLSADDLSPFGAVTTLTLSSTLVHSLTHTPPSLRTLIVRDIRGGIPESPKDRVADSILWWLVLHIKRAFPAWAAESPDFKELEFWDVTNRRGMGIWKLVSFLLRGHLDQFGVSLEVALTLDFDTQNYYIGKFDDQEMIRRFLWKDVL
ncbi:hypothetical protein AURDEDRAFT_147475 [Auricularia subglabra TFB-10046 SS5]|uniref:F-box domain-containing protein n=1 Tax=Auricularia subglabra (strain TFB-10046 / SS5) TaxID=717982 RepID=J0D7Z2_AURST|nr:hypothetical protein AURDEDRAFT_147475 [Auricularia subglabra TFB-10046 SS5]